MLKNIYNKLLSKYPLLWNTRIVFLLPIIIGLHLLFYLSGYSNVVSLGQLHQWDLLEIYSVITFSVLVSLVLIIIWLVFYLRNNPFKSFYTLGRNYLFFEFIIHIVVFFSSATFFLTYKQGLYDNIKALTKNIDIVEEADKANLACHFMAFAGGDFDIRNCCDSLNARQVRDSIANANRILNQGTDRKNEYSGDADAATSEYQETVTIEEPVNREDTVKYPKSYLFCCNQFFHFYDTSYFLKSREELSAHANSWFKGGNKDSVLMSVKEFENLCDKYDIGYNIDEDSILIECFNNPLFTPKQLYGQNAYINTSDLQNAFDRIIEVRDGFWSGEILLIMVMYTLGMAILLFTFRITLLKPWLIGVIGVAILGIILGLIASTMDGEGILYVLVLLWVLFLVVALNWIFDKKNKLNAGIVFNWLMWLTPFIAPIVVFLYQQYLYIPCDQYYSQVNCPPQLPEYIWLNSHWLELIYANILLTIPLFYFLFIPLARKWQSNPEE